MSAKLRVSNVALHIRSKAILGGGLSDQQILSANGFADWHIYWETALSRMWNAWKFVNFLESFMLVRAYPGAEIRSPLAVIAAPFHEAIQLGEPWIVFNRFAREGAELNRLGNYNVTDSQAAVNWIMGKPIYRDDCLPPTLRDVLSGAGNVAGSSQPNRQSRGPRTIEGESTDVSDRPAIEHQETVPSLASVATPTSSRSAYTYRLRSFIEANLSQQKCWTANEWAKAAEQAEKAASSGKSPWPHLPKRRALRAAVEKILTPINGT